MQKKEKDGGWAGTVVEEDGWTGACNVPAGGNKSGGGTTGAPIHKAIFVLLELTEYGWCKLVKKKLLLHDLRLVSFC